MSLIKFGNDALFVDSRINNNTIVSHNPEQATLVEFGDRASAQNSNFDGNESHTPESLAIKLAHEREILFKNLEFEISRLENEVVKAKLLKELNEIKEAPLTAKGQLLLNRALNGFKDFALDLGAKVVAEITMKQLGY